MTSSLDRSSPWRPALLIAIAAVLLSATLDVALSSRLRTYRERTEASEASLGAIASLRAHLVDAETGQRGYLLTGSGDYLVPYLSARGKVGADLDSLARQDAIVDSGATIRRLRGLAQAKISELDSTVRLRQLGRTESALALVNTNQGKEIMDTVRQLTRELNAAHYARLADQRESERALSSMVLLVLLAGGAALLGVMAYLWYTLRRYERSQGAAQREMERQLAELEVVMRERTASGPAAPSAPIGGA